ncbi:MAG: efflux transporter outer membrane subunit [Alphaproteobacteria bacterium]|nr:efflux transporter outer membrane subunit [Alphaproteobacteria bacterium]
MNYSNASLQAAAKALALACVLSGCAVGPDFRQPDAPSVKSYDADNPIEQTVSANVAGGVSQRFVHGQDIPSAWWTLFRSESLNKLIAKSLESNPSLQAAQASLRSVEENFYAGEGAFFPSVTAGGTATRQKANGNISSLYNASVSVSYNLDVFGGTRRTVEALDAYVENERFQLEATHLSLTSNVVTAAIQEASVRAQIEALREVIAGERKQLDIMKKQFELGAISAAPVLAQTAALSQTEASLPALEKQWMQAKHQLSALAGRFPSEAMETVDLDVLQLPEDLPLTLPSKLVEQRPDIKAAEAIMRAANAKIGVATANMLPQITLSGSTGSSATDFANLFTPGAAIWSLAGGVTQPIFRAGELMHKRLAAKADYDAAEALYRSTVIAAFQNVADTLRALQKDAETVKLRLAAEKAALASLAITQSQFQNGAVDYVAVLTAEETYQQAKMELVKARASRYADTAALFQALGGGWWNRANDKIISEKEKKDEAVVASSKGDE